MQFTTLLTTTLLALATTTFASPTPQFRHFAQTIRVQLSNDAVDASVQSEIPIGAPTTLTSAFGTLGEDILTANRALIVSGKGKCQIFADLAGQEPVGAPLVSGGGDVDLTEGQGGQIVLQNGIIFCL